MRKKKIVKVTLTIIIMLLLLLYLVHKLTYQYDKNAIQNGNPPVFSIAFIRIKDGGSNIYYGVGYQILRWHTELETGERKIAYEIYKYPHYKDWKEGPEPSTLFFEYAP
jgi:hypothetical protein